MNYHADLDAMRQEVRYQRIREAEMAKRATALEQAIAAIEKLLETPTPQDEPPDEGAA